MAEGDTRAFPRVMTCAILEAAAYAMETIDLMEPTADTLMAKKKAAPKKASSTPEEWNRKPPAFQIRGSAEWKAWVVAFAEKEGDAVAKLFERAVRDHAKARGFPEPPSR